DAYMEVFPYGGSGDFSYEWWPTTGLSDPNSAVTHATGVHEQQYIATVTDNVTGCVVTDSIIVSSYVPHFDTLYLCNDSVLLDLGPGGDFYNWVPYYSADYETQAIWVDQPGDYLAYANFPGCGALTSVFPVIECPSTCSVTVSSDLTYLNCGAHIQLTGNYSSPIDSAVWDLGNGQTAVDYGNGIPPVFYTGGSYMVTVTAYHTGGCVSSTSYSIILLTDIIAEINLGGDTIACNGQLGLGVNVTGGGGQYGFAWHPAPHFNDPTSQYPFLTVAQNMWVTVTVTDFYTGCVTTDSVYVYANQEINETIELCNPNVALTVDPGSLIYNWTFTPVGGNLVTLPNQTNELVVSNLGTYTCFTYSSGCASVEHTFEVIACGTNCSVDLAYSHNSLNCGDHYYFFVNASSTTDSVVFDYGDGTTFTSTGISGDHYYGPGNYIVTVTAYHNNGCISTDFETISINSGVGIEILGDTVACNGSLFLSHTISGGSGNYMFNWTPAGMMNDPTAANPVMDVLHDTWVEVVLHDTQQGCTAYDSIYVYANSPISETLTLCTDSIYLEVNPGSQVYQWSFTDAFGNTIQLQEIDNDLWAHAVGTYVCFTYSSGCNPTTHAFVVEDCGGGNDDVWPGDANSDNIVTNADALYLGLAFNQTGPVRPAATLNWAGQPCPDWTFNFAINNVNLKHADCDGNGIINFDDTLAIDFNYLQTHNKFETPPPGGNPLLWVQAEPDTVGLEQFIDITVHLGTVDQPVDSLHGVAFSLTFNETLVTENGFTVDFDNCALGTAGNDVLTFQKSLFSDGAIDLAVTRNTLQNFQGYGPIAHARIVTTDNLSGITELRVGLGGVVALTANEDSVLLSTRADTVVIDPSKVGIVEPAQLEVMVYPNPSNGLINILGVDDAQLAALNALGQRVYESRVLNNRTTIDLSTLNNGIYILKLKNQHGVAVRRVRILR
nr:T9SS type A sorting domain-containing protein [Flavobacteriales bacterium]